MSWLSLGAEFGAGCALIAVGIAVTWLAQGRQPTALGLSIIPVGILAMIVIGGTLILNSLRFI